MIILGSDKSFLLVESFEDYFLWFEVACWSSCKVFWCLIITVFGTVVMGPRLGQGNYLFAIFW